MFAAHILIWIAVGLMVVHVMGHMVGVATWKRSSTSAHKVVIDHMTQHKFPFMGVKRSLGESFEGFGHAATLSMCFIALLLGIVSFHLADSAILAHIFLLVSGFYLLAWAIDEIIFFFPFAASLSALSGVLVLTAWYLVR